MYIKGDHWMVCEICGFNFRRSQMKETWDGLWVCEADWEPKHPQLSVKGKKDDQRVDVVRPDKASTLGTTTLAAAASADAKYLNLSSASGISSGDSIGITLDDGTVQWLFVDGDPFTLNTPVLHYKFDETTGVTCSDESGDYDGTFTNGPGDDSQWVSGQVDNALDFDGTDDYVDVGDPLESTFQSASSISTYFNIDDGTPAATTCLFSNFAASSGYITGFVDTTGTFLFYYYDGTTLVIFSTGVELSDGASGYKHLLVSFNSNEIRGFLDSVRMAPVGNTGDMSSISMSDYSSSQNLYLGIYGDATSFPYDGKLDDFRIYDQAIDTPEKVSLVYTNSGGVVKISDYLWGAAASGNTVYLSSSADVPFYSTVAATDL